MGNDGAVVPRAIALFNETVMNPRFVGKSIPANALFLNVQCTITSIGPQRRALF
jgi:hypothetical protein